MLISFPKIYGTVPNGVKIAEKTAVHRGRGIYHAKGRTGPAGPKNTKAVKGLPHPAFKGKKGPGHHRPGAHGDGGFEPWNLLPSL